MFFHDVSWDKGTEYKVRLVGLLGKNIVELPEKFNGKCIQK